MEQTLLLLHSFLNQKREFTFSCARCGKLKAKGRIGIVVVYADKKGRHAELVSDRLRCCGIDQSMPQLFPSIDEANVALAAYTEELDRWANRAADDQSDCPIKMVPGSLMGLNPDSMDPALFRSRKQPPPVSLN
ncbi:MAG: hypothetical protein AAB582_03495 [Patescibacteria group bacterium]